MNNAVKYLTEFARRETVLCAAAALALLSACFVPPDPAYLGYIDWNTLALLFSLMAVVRLCQKAGLFLFLGDHLLRRTVSTREMMLVLVFLPFFFSMVITNDVSLITFVPFAVVVLRMAGQERLLVPVAILQTLAANLGSMLTPMGNPQNLYLYTHFDLGFGELCRLMSPYVLLAGACLAVMVFLRPSAHIAPVAVDARLAAPGTLACCGVGTALCLLAIFELVPPVLLAAGIALFLFFADREVLSGVDFSLLGTFAGFFIFIGNLGRLDGFREILTGALSGHVEAASILASQVISNVPAALLLSGFTDQWQALAVGCNLGGLGTLIASMASLISYKQVAAACPQRRRVYLVRFTLCNIALLALLLAQHAWLVLHG